MGTRTISIDDDAYKRLASLKKDNESFSIVIKRVTSGNSLSLIQGILSKESADKMEKAIMRSRKEQRKMREQRIKKIQKQLKS